MFRELVIRKKLDGKVVHPAVEILLDGKVQNMVSRLVLQMEAGVISTAEITYLVSVKSVAVRAKVKKGKQKC